MRLFIGVSLPAESNTYLAEQLKVMGDLPGIRWVKPANLHITLAFLGEVAPQQVAQLQQLIKEPAAVADPFELSLGTRIAVFPGWQRPKVIWLGIEQGHGELHTVQSSLASALRRHGFPTEDKPYKPHITLGRVRDGLLPDVLEKVKRQTWLMPAGLITGITLYESTFSQAGPTYREIGFAAFKKGVRPRTS